jgi:hypothetical protein
MPESALRNGRPVPRPGDTTGIRRWEQQDAKLDHAAAVQRSIDALRGQDDIEIVALPGGGGSFAIPRVVYRFLVGDLTGPKVVNRDSHRRPVAQRSAHAGGYVHPSDPSFVVEEL